MRWSLLLCCACLLQAAVELPTGPADPQAFPGLALSRRPQLREWPPLCTGGAAWQVSLSVPLPRDDGERRALLYRRDSSGLLRWDGQAPLDFRLRGEAGASVGLVARLPTTAGQQRLHLELASSRHDFPLLVIDAGQAAWPALRWADGLTWAGPAAATVLLGEAGEREAGLLAWRALPAATGPAVLLGDPLAVSGRGLDALLPGLPLVVDCRGHGRGDGRLLPWLAGLGAELPATIVWSPGDGPLRHGRRWRDEELWLRTIPARCQALGRRSRLICLLPPLPVEQGLRADATRRNRLLREAALVAGWEVFDAAALVGEPLRANRLAEGLWAPWPVGVAQETLARELGAILRGVEPPVAVAFDGLLLAPQEQAWLTVRLGGRHLAGDSAVALDDGPWLPLQVQPGLDLARWLPLPAEPAERILRLRLGERLLERRISLLDSAVSSATQWRDDGSCALICRAAPLAPPDGSAGAGILWLGGDDAGTARELAATRLTAQAPGPLLAEPWPAAQVLVCWQPGAEPAVAHSEPRLLSALAWRLRREQPGARAVLILPAAAGPDGEQRRAVLRGEAFAAGWLILDPAALPSGATVAGVLRQLAAQPGLAAERSRLTGLPPVMLYRGDRWQFCVEQAAWLLDGALRLAGAEGLRPFDLNPDGVARAWQPIVAQAGGQEIALLLGEECWPLRLRFQDLSQGWPAVEFREGALRDPGGQAVVLVSAADGEDDLRRWQLFTGGSAQAGTVECYWGELPAALPGGQWLAGELPALALVEALGRRQPRRLVWFLPAALGDDPAAGRLLELIPWRLRSSGLAAELELVLPEDAGIGEELRRQALFHGWQVRDRSAWELRR